MTLHQFIQLFWEQVKETSWLEWVACIFGIVEVLLAKKNNIWLYPAGILATMAGIYLYLQGNHKLYAEALLNVYYVVMSFYGWIHWVKRRNEPPVKISWSTPREWWITLLITFGGWALLWYLLKSYTTSNVPVWDAFVSASAWAGMWLLARRKIENWILLNVSNLFAIPLLFKKELPLLVLLTVFLFVVAIFGYLEWLRILKKDKAETSRTATVN